MIPPDHLKNGVAAKGSNKASISFLLFFNIFLQCYCSVPLLGVQIHSFQAFLSSFHNPQCSTQT